MISAPRYAGHFRKPSWGVIRRNLRLVVFAAMSATLSPGAQRFVNAANWSQQGLHSPLASAKRNRVMSDSQPHGVPPSGDPAATPHLQRRFGVLQATALNMSN